MQTRTVVTSSPRYTLHSERDDLPLLIKICGLDGSGKLFYKQIPSLAKSYRVVTFPLRDDPAATYEMLADDVAAIIEAIGEGKAVVVGESFGGGIAFSFALRYPQMLDRLVIVNSFAWYRRRLRIHAAAKLATVLPKQFIVPFRLMSATLGLLVDGVKGEDRLRILQVLQAIEMKGYARRLQLISEVNLLDRLSEIQAPTLLIATPRDLLVPSVREAHEMAARMPNATVKIIDKAGHSLLLRDDVQLSDILAEWRSV